MSWSIEYFEQSDTTQAAELFEDSLAQQYPKLLGKLLRAIDALAQTGPQTGGGLIEPGHGYAGLWEIRAICSQQLARAFFGFDGPHVVLLHGFIKRSGKATPERELHHAAAYWQKYSQTHATSPEQPE